MNTSYLEVSVRTNPLGQREAYNYRWVGESPYLSVSLDVVDSPEVKKLNGEKEIQIGPFHLLKVDDNFSGFHVTYVRKDRLGALRVALYRATRLLDLTYRRCILTLAVWNLAEFHGARIPTWHDIKMLKRFIK